VNSDAKVVMREATEGDLDRIVAMMGQLALHDPPLPFDVVAVRSAWMQFLTDPGFGKAWLIDVYNKSVGYVILTLGFSFEYHGREAFIDELYVEPDFRGQGLGTHAMKFVAEQARALGVNAIHLEVDPQNADALSLYRRLDYVDHNRRLMTKWLKTAVNSNLRI
jgi:ribosomal protein S18 acetylase RimI-like enzyme